ncbi:hypothetical protein C5Z25_01755 [Lactobacillus sp. CBA3605]|uniref:PTS glucose transporter subunit IIA n=1 Tax=Lactobacillus sp. CBA3605 TaxID=2099788 RepID=UPI000CFA97D1|nr:PTS glucose transporter subunit IIA [Lactobacillus sp. CBA3605]AVK60571.1 hypothetical protein C5Z25_01755 [Lactobacillus sp. CBA3605]
MGFWRQQQLSKLSAPVQGRTVDLAAVPAMTAATAVLALQPSNDAVYSPVNGEVLALTSQRIKFQALDGRQYWLRLAAGATQLVGQFEWQVRVGDTVSPITLLGTLSIAAVDSAVVVCDELIPVARRSAHGRGLVAQLLG